jgi:hypothetical protein
MSQFLDKMTYFKKKQEELFRLEAEFKHKCEEYRAELKSWCGITDGERTDVLEILGAVKKVQEMD